jgi:uncharacterized integral membrane protein
MFFVEKDSFYEKYHFCLEMYKFKLQPIQVPYLYHYRFLQMVNILIKQMDLLAVDLSHMVKEMFKID